MPKIAYIDKKFKAPSLERIDQANRIIRDYQSQGLMLTLRQLYYRLVAAALIPNTEKSYDNLGALISEARLAGLVDWSAIEDRTRNLQSLPTWRSPQAILDAVADQYRIDLWSDQPCRPEVWVEKEALAGVIGRTAVRERVDYFACRGYVSSSEMWDAAQRLIRYSKKGQQPHIIHLGDHDPSGIDMSRDILDRLRLFMESHGVYDLKVKRIALNMNQVEQYNPPPNPAKTTDARFAAYLDRFGDESWELDALEPRVLDRLVEGAIRAVRDDARYAARQEVERMENIHLRVVNEKWPELSGWDGYFENTYPEDIERLRERAGLNGRAAETTDDEEESEEEGGEEPEEEDED